MDRKNHIMDVAFDRGPLTGQSRSLDYKREIIVHPMTVTVPLPDAARNGRWRAIAPIDLLKMSTLAQTRQPSL